MKTAKKKLREQDRGELVSPLCSLRGELSYRQNETEGAVSRMKTKVRLHIQTYCSCSKMIKKKALNILDIVNGFSSCDQISFILFLATVFLPIFALPQFIY